MFKLDLRSRSPIYEQLMDKVKEMIINHVLPPDQQLPSVRELALELGINPNTIQKAFRELEHQGYIYSIQGKGNFVMPRVNMDNSKRRASIMLDFKRLINELLFLGLSPEELQKTLENCVTEFIAGKAALQNAGKGAEQ